jgi:hypothetical protein
MPVTYYVVVYFDRDAEGDLKAGEAMEVTSATAAERAARSLSHIHAGPVAFSRLGDPATASTTNESVGELRLAKGIPAYAVYQGIGRDGWARIEGQAVLATSPLKTENARPPSGRCWSFADSRSPGRYGLPRT